MEKILRILKRAKVRNWDKDAESVAAFLAQRKEGRREGRKRMKESEERIHEGSQAIAVGNNNPCREMRRALSVDENQTHFSFLPRNFLPSMGISHSVSIFGDALIFPRFNTRRDETTRHQTRRISS